MFSYVLPGAGGLDCDCHCLCLAMCCLALVAWTVIVTAYVAPVEEVAKNTTTSLTTNTNTTFPAACTFNSSLPIENVGL